jgi:hypothetical protein
MPYVSLNAADIEAGKPVKEEIFSTIKDNEDYLNSAVAALQQSALVDIFNIKFGGDISNYTEAEITARIPVFKAPVDALITSFVITLLAPSTSGTLEIEIDKSTDNGVNWVALLNNPVAVTGLTTGSLSGTVDWVDVPSQSFNQGDLIRLRPTGIQVDQGEFQVAVYGEIGG